MVMKEGRTVLIGAGKMIVVCDVQLALFFSF